MTIKFLSITLLTAALLFFEQASAYNIEELFSREHPSRIIQTYHEVINHIPYRSSIHQMPDTVKFRQEFFNIKTYIHDITRFQLSTSYVKLWEAPTVRPIFFTPQESKTFEDVFDDDIPEWRPNDQLIVTRIPTPSKSNSCAIVKYVGSIDLLLTKLCCDIPWINYFLGDKS